VLTAILWGVVFGRGPRRFSDSRDAQICMRGRSREHDRHDQPIPLRLGSLEHESRCSGSDREA
jgi:hypothetical protein